jgi:hypothetical protein
MPTANYDNIEQHCFLTSSSGRIYAEVIGARIRVVNPPLVGGASFARRSPIASTLGYRASLRPTHDQGRLVVVPIIDLPPETFIYPHRHISNTIVMNFLPVDRCLPNSRFFLIGLTTNRHIA